MPSWPVNRSGSPSYQPRHRSSPAVPVIDKPRDPDDSLFFSGELEDVFEPKSWFASLRPERAPDERIARRLHREIASQERSRHLHTAPRPPRRRITWPKLSHIRLPDLRPVVAMAGAGMAMVAIAVVSIVVSSSFFSGPTGSHHAPLMPSAHASAGLSQSDLALQQHSALAAELHSRLVQTTTPAVSPPPGPSYSPPAPFQPNVGGGGPLSPAQVGAIWLTACQQAGGAPSCAAAETTAECIANAESGDNPDADNGVDVGIWQIDVAHMGSNGIPSTYDAFVAYEKVPANNASEAVLLSANGTNWSQWTTHAACGV